MTDTTELVNDLRKPWTDVGHWQNLGQQAADEITRLQAELDAANEKLAWQPIDPDADAALEKVKREAWNEAMDEVADTIEGEYFEEGLADKIRALKRETRHVAELGKRLSRLKSRGSRRRLSHKLSR